jgi:hypothetical protein
MTPRMTIHTVAIRDDGCFSAVLWDGRPIAVSVERTFEPGEAAHGKRVVIPEGIHRCTRRRYYKGGYETWEIHIEGHEAVLFHKGNLETHSLACVILGEQFGELNGKTAVLASGDAFMEFMKLTYGLDEFYVEVLNR